MAIAMKRILSLLACAVLHLQPAFAAGPSLHETAVVLVDMQPPFYMGQSTEKFRRLLERQSSLLRWAVKKRVPVLIFQFQGGGDTDPALANLLQHHPRVAVWKDRNDGFSGESGVSARAALTRWKVTDLIVAGINSRACVHDTVLGALKYGYTVYTSRDIVATMAWDPIYPDGEWFVDHANFHGYKSLDRVLE